MIRSFLIVLTAIGIIYGAYWYGKNSASLDNLSKPVETAVAEEVESTTNPPTPTIESSTPEEDYILHEIKPNEILYTIGLQYDLMWNRIAEYNGIDENTPLIVGEYLKIPLKPSGELIKEEVLSLSEEETKKAQEQANNGDNVWRRDPIAVVRQTVPIDYNLKNDDTYSLINLDKTAGTATVEVTHDKEIFNLDLTQPQEKGEQGVWYIIKIESVKTNDTK